MHRAYTKPTGSVVLHSNGKSFFAGFDLPFFPGDDAAEETRVPGLSDRITSYTQGEAR